MVVVGPRGQAEGERREAGVEDEEGAVTESAGVRKRSIAKGRLAEQLHGKGMSAMRRYQSKVFGDPGLIPFLGYEMATFLFGDFPGALGYALRRSFYARLFRRMGRGVILGKGVALRHPRRIVLGDRVAIDDGAMLDASGAVEGGIVLGDEVIVSRHCVIQSKNGPVAIGDRTDIGCHCILSSVSGVVIGRSGLIAGHCYIGGGRYHSDRRDMPMMDQGLYSLGPVSIGDDVWLGAGAVVLDGVRIGTGAVIGAGAVVTRDIPDYTIAVGAPARVIGSRGAEPGAA
jgi:acetyltransferase-like isoleucine patch superfamily enzyme